MLNKNYLCLKCNEAVFNPICPICLAQEIFAWLRKLNARRSVKKKIMNITINILNQNRKNEGFHTKCIICNEDNSYMCPYCFTEKIWKEIKELNIERRIKKEYLTFFNFDFEHKGYCKDAEKLGL